MKPRPWTPSDDAILREHYGQMRLDALSILLDRTECAIKTRAQRLGLGQRQFWTQEEDARFIAEYPHSTDTADLARRMGRTEKALYGRAKTLGLHKTQAALDAIQARTNKVLEQAGICARFQKGNAPWNQGLAWENHPEACRATQFKPGQRPHTWRPIGTERINRDGYRERKITDDGHPKDHYEAVHRLIWIEAHGPIPAGHVVGFRNGDKTDIRLDNLELISRAELADRNHFKRYPAELRRLIGQKAWLTRTIRNRTKDLEETCATE